MEKKQARRTGRKPKTDPADYKYNFRLNAQEKSRFERLFWNPEQGTGQSYQEINLFRTAEGNQGGQGFHGLLHPARGILQYNSRQ